MGLSLVLTLPISYLIRGGVRNYLSPVSLTGSVLIAAPALKDPCFRKTILFLPYYNPEEGALGFVLNRPLHKTIGEVYPTPSTFAPVPLFYGGPVAPGEVSIASLRWVECPRGVKFQSFTNLSESLDIAPEWTRGLRAFAGYSGWNRGQLEEEIAANVWFLIQPNRDLINMPHPTSAWKETICQMNPIFKLLTEVPDDPSLN